ncbi:arsenic metallochaperone ArsD family protein [Sorangium sp. So ce887]
MSVTLRVFDPAMCCSTGVCGPSVDPELARFAADVDWLQKQGVTVERYNLSQQPSAFAGTPAVKEALARGTEVACGCGAVGCTEGRTSPARSLR